MVEHDINNKHRDKIHTTTRTPSHEHETRRCETPRPRRSQKSGQLSKFLAEVLQLTKMPSKRMAGNLMQAWQALANKPNAKDMPAFVVVVPQLLAAFASHSVTVSAAAAAAAVCCLCYSPAAAAAAARISLSSRRLVPPYSESLFGLRLLCYRPCSCKL